MKKRFKRINDWEMEGQHKQFIVSFIISFVIILFLSLKSNINYVWLVLLPYIGAWISSLKITTYYEEV